MAVRLARQESGREETHCKMRATTMSAKLSDSMNRITAAGVASVSVSVSQQDCRSETRTSGHEQQPDRERDLAVLVPRADPSGKRRRDDQTRGVGCDEPPSLAADVVVSERLEAEGDDGDDKRVAREVDEDAPADGESDEPGTAALSQEERRSSAAERVRLVTRTRHCGSSFAQLVLVHLRRRRLRLPPQESSTALHVGLVALASERDVGE